MGFFDRIFGKGDPMASLRRALEQRRWAEALAIGEEIDHESLPPEARGDLEGLLRAAGDGLAELNLSEGDACIRAGDRDRAAEHFSLAAGQARSAALLRRATESLERLQRGGDGGSEPEPDTGAAGCGSACGGHAASPRREPVEEESVDGLDSQTRLELILASYPQELVERYGALEGEFREAFLLAHEGRESEALELFERVPKDYRNDLYFFERGALRGRLGETEGAFRDLEKALALNPEHLLCLETLVSLEILAGLDRRAEERLEAMLQKGRSPGFCHGSLAVICARKGDVERAIDHGLRSIDQGFADPQTLLLTASLLEKAGRLDEAEGLLMRLSPGGCGGRVSVHLGEFWLRRNLHPEKALEAFKGALRQDPDNPRWQLRIGQAYIARGWRKDGLPFLEKALADPRLDEGLAEEGKRLLTGLNRNGMHSA